MGAGSGARRLSGLHAQGQHRRRLSRRRPRAARPRGVPSIPQFATHNAHTIAAIAVLAGTAPTSSSASMAWARRCIGRWCGPRRSANPAASMRRSAGTATCSPISCAGCWRTAPTPPSSTASPTMQAPVAAIIADPVEKAAALQPKANPLIPAPPDLFAPARRNSSGLALWEPSVREPLTRAIEQALAVPAEAGPIVAGEEVGQGEVVEITSPHDRSVIVGTCRFADAETIDRALDAAKAASQAWDRRGGTERAAILERAADLFEARPRRADGADGARGGQDASQCAGRSSRGGRPSTLRGV